MHKFQLIVPDLDLTTSKTEDRNGRPIIHCKKVRDNGIAIKHLRHREAELLAAAFPSTTWERVVAEEELWLPIRFTLDPRSLVPQSSGLILTIYLVAAPTGRAVRTTGLKTENDVAL